MNNFFNIKLLPLIIPIFFIGISIADSLSYSINSSEFYMILCILIIVLCLWLFFSENFIAPINYLLGFLFWLSFAFCITVLYNHNHKVITKNLFNVNVVGDVASIVPLDNGKRNYKVIIANAVINGDLKNYYKIQVKFGNVDKIPIGGETISFRANIYKTKTAINYWDLDLLKIVKYKNISAYGTAKKGFVVVNKYTNDYITLFVGSLSQFRLEIHSKLSNSYSKNVVNFVSTVILGYSELLDENYYSNIKSSGIAHLFSISGFHIGIIASILILVIKFLISLYPNIPQNLNIRKISFICAVPILTLYAIFTGLNPPVFRALLCFYFIVYMVVFDKTTISLHNLVLVGIIIICFNPYVIYSASFQLSFIATASILLFFNLYQNNFIYFYSGGIIGRIDKMRKNLITLVGVSIMTSLFTALFTGYHFGMISFGGVFANIILVPIFATLVMPLAIVVYFLTLANVSSVILDKLFVVVLNIFESIVSYFSLGEIKFSLFNHWYLLIFVITIILISVTKWSSIRNLILICIIFVFSAYFLPLKSYEPIAAFITKKGKAGFWINNDTIYYYGLKTTDFNFKRFVQVSGISKLKKVDCLQGCFIKNINAFYINGDFDLHNDDNLKLLYDNYDYLDKYDTRGGGFAFKANNISSDYCKNGVTIISAGFISNNNCYMSNFYDTYYFVGTLSISLFNK